MAARGRLRAVAAVGIVLLCAIVAVHPAVEANAGAIEPGELLTGLTAISMGSRVARTPPRGAVMPRRDCF